MDVAPELQWEASYKAEMPEEVQEDEHGNLIPVDSEAIWHGDRLWRANRIVVPPSQVKSVLDQCHRLCGHWGVKRTTSLVERRYEVKDLAEVTKAYVRVCHE